MSGRLPPDHVPPPTARLDHGSPRRVQVELVAIAGAALLVVALGLGLGGPPDPTASPGASDAALASGSPRAATSASPQPTGPCRTVDQLDTPRLELWSTSDDRDPVPGVRLPPRVPPATPFSGWLVPSLAGATLLPDDTARLHLFADDAGCLASVEVAVGSADAEEPGTDATTVDLDAGLLPADHLDLGGLPTGDWVLRVEVTFQVSGGAVMFSPPETTFFRVVSGPVTELVPSPQVTPAVACRSDAGNEDVELVIGDRPPYAGSANEPEPIQVTLGERIEVRTIGDWCARSWSIAVFDAVGNSLLQDAYPNPVSNPFEAAQNRWHVNQLLIGEATLQATIGLGPHRGIAAEWRLLVTSPPLPTVRAIGADGQVVELRPGCGQFWGLGEAGSAFEPCDVQTLPSDLPVLELADGAAVRLEAADGSITEWFGRCGAASDGPAGQPIFMTVDECNLGEGTGGTDVAFIPWPGDRLILAGITIERDGTTIYGNYFGRIVVGE